MTKTYITKQDFSKIIDQVNTDRHTNISATIFAALWLMLVLVLTIPVIILAFPFVIIEELIRSVTKRNKI